mmetsp:Transcript_3040/g.8052  ORF Transcript_3040/g.8052 Transcript_3040/m.8052 type:complete len:413 (-) Transcript_3040:145-1383(-)
MRCLPVVSLFSPKLGPLGGSEREALSEGLEFFVGLSDALQGAQRLPNGPLDLLHVVGKARPSRPVLGPDLACEFHVNLQHPPRELGDEAVDHLVRDAPVRGLGLELGQVLGAAVGDLHEEVGEVDGDRVSALAAPALGEVLLLDVHDGLLQHLEHGAEDGRHGLGRDLLERLEGVRERVPRPLVVQLVREEAQGGVNLLDAAAEGDVSLLLRGAVTADLLHFGARRHERVRPLPHQPHRLGHVGDARRDKVPPALRRRASGNFREEAPDAPLHVARRRQAPAVGREQNVHRLDHPVQRRLLERVLVRLHAPQQLAGGGLVVWQRTGNPARVRGLLLQQVDKGPEAPGELRVVSHQRVLQRNALVKCGAEPAPERGTNRVPQCQRQSVGLIRSRQELLLLLRRGGGGGGGSAA